MRLHRFILICIICSLGLLLLPISSFAQNNFSELIVARKINIEKENARIKKFLQQLQESADVSGGLAEARHQLNAIKIEIEAGGVIRGLDEQLLKLRKDTEEKKKLSPELYGKIYALLDIKAKELSVVKSAENNLLSEVDALEKQLILWQADYRVILELDAKTANNIISKFITEYLAKTRAPVLQSEPDSFSRVTVINKQPLAPTLSPSITASSREITSPQMEPVANFGEGIANLFNINKIDQRPTPRVQPQPAYPYELSRAGISGDVVVEYIINENGDVIDTRIVRSSHQGFEIPAVQAVQQWKFKAGRKGGKAVKVRVSQLIEFNLEDSR